MNPEPQCIDLAALAIQIMNSPWFPTGTLAAIASLTTMALNPPAALALATIVSALMLPLESMMWPTTAALALTSAALMVAKRQLDRQ